jgi:hypothetical protein
MRDFKPLFKQPLRKMLVMSSHFELAGVLENPVAECFGLCDHKRVEELRGISGEFREEFALVVELLQKCMAFRNVPSKIANHGLCVF